MLFVNKKYESINRILSKANEELSIVTEADNSWGEKFESIICDAFNCKGDVTKSKEIKRYEEDMLSHGMDPKSVYKNIYDSVSRDIGDLSTVGKLRKLENRPDCITDDWVSLGYFKSKSKVNSTPKTDITNGADINISVKDDTGGRGMSGAINETIATIRNAIEKAGDEKTLKLADEFFGMFTSSGKVRDRLSTRNVSKDTVSGKYGEIGALNFDFDSISTDDEDEQKVIAMQKMINRFNSFMEKEINSNKSIQDAILREAFTGETKFDPPACANKFLIWDKKSGKCKVYDKDDYLALRKSKYKVKAVFKSSSIKNKKNPDLDLGRDIWIVLSIT